MSRYQWYLPNNQYKIELPKFHLQADLKLLKLSQTSPVWGNPDIKLQPTHSGLTAQRHHKFTLYEGWSCFRMEQQFHVPQCTSWSTGMTIQKVPDWWQPKPNLFHFYLCYHSTLKPHYNKSTRTQRATLFVGHGLGLFLLLFDLFFR